MFIVRFALAENAKKSTAEIISAVLVGDIEVFLWD